MSTCAGTIRRLTRRDAPGRGLRGRRGAGARRPGLVPQASVRESEGTYRPVQDGPPELLAPRPHQNDGKADLQKALAATKELGVHYWESYPAHVPMITDAAKLAEHKRQIEAAGRRRDRLRRRPFRQGRGRQPQVFEFAKAMGLTYLSADPDPDSLRQPRQAGRGVRHRRRHPQPRPGPPLRQDRRRSPRRSRTTTPRSAAASTPATSSGRRKTPSAPSRSSASGSTASTSRTSRTPRRSPSWARATSGRSTSSRRWRQQVRLLPGDRVRGERRRTPSTTSRRA